jgi:cation diffusion facilitator CzcD-associated flavoprotein CzcO
LDLSSAWKADGKFGFPYTYLGLATPGFPNLFFIHGPNASGASGTLPHSAENQITYIARVLRKVNSQGIKTIVPKKAAADDFVEYCDKFFPQTVLTEQCSSWSNGKSTCI